MEVEWTVGGDNHFTGLATFKTPPEGREAVPSLSMIGDIQASGNVSGRLSGLDSGESVLLGTLIREDSQLTGTVILQGSGPRFEEIPVRVTMERE